MSDKKKYRVDGYDSFSGEEFPVGSYDTAEQAVEIAKQRSGQMTLMYVYDADGSRIFQAGSF